MKSELMGLYIDILKHKRLVRQHKNCITTEEKGVRIYGSGLNNTESCMLISNYVFDPTTGETLRSELVI